MVPTEHKKHENTEGDMASGLSNDASSFDWKQDHTQSLPLLGQKNSHHTLVQVSNGLVMMTFQVTQSKCVIMQQNVPLTRWSKFINLIPNHHTVITRINTNHQYLES